jgi:hypothetical protein
MGTKNNPGKFDCLSAAEPDEPMFHLLARDPSAPWFVAMWAAVRADDMIGAVDLLRQAHAALKKAGKRVLAKDDPKYLEAKAVSLEMLAWCDRRAAPNAEGQP